MIISLKNYTNKVKFIQYDLFIENERSKNAKLRFNYLMVVAVLCEFFNKWCFSVFDTVVPVYGQRKHELDSFTFSMMSVVGSLINIFQTGWLFNFLLRHGFSIPTITSWGGLTYSIFLLFFLICSAFYCFMSLF